MYIGVDIGGTKCAVVLGRETVSKPEIIDKQRFETIHGENGASLTVGKLKAAIGQLIKQADGKIEGVGISCGGPLSSKRGVIMRPPNLPEWDGVAIVDDLRDTFGVPVYLQNDANACAYAEYRYGAGRGHDNIVFLTFGTGMGAGLVLGGRLYCGSSDMAGEVGHIRLARRGPVGYGKAGSFEGFCSGGGIARLAIEAVKKAVERGEKPKLLDYCGSYENITAKAAAELADGGDKLCAGVYKKSGEMLGRGLAVIIDIINPDAIIIGSVFTRSEKLLRSECERYIKKEALPYSAECCEILCSQLGDSIGDYAALSVACGRF